MRPKRPEAKTAAQPKPARRANVQAGERPARRPEGGEAKGKDAPETQRRRRRPARRGSGTAQGARDGARAEQVRAQRGSASDGAASPRIEGREDELRRAEGASESSPRREYEHENEHETERRTEVIAQIRELEAQLDRLIDEASRRDLAELAGDDEPEVAASAPAHEEAPPTERDEEKREDAWRAPRPSTPQVRPSVTSVTEDRSSASSVTGGETTVFDTARELLSTDFYLRKWGRLAMRGRSEEVDDFGFDPVYEQKARGILEFLYTRYFRVQTTGIENVPSHGRCVLVANHSGTLPLDGVMLKTAVKLEHASPRDVRWLTEDFIYHMPYLGSMMNRLGAVRACQENAERLLAKEQLVAVFPEGVKGIGKLFSERYRLQRFGRGGFIKLCLRTQTPIVPVAIVGAEETNPLLFRVEYLSKALGLPYIPITPTFPALGPLGLLPAPTKWQIHFGEMIDFSGHGREAAEDELLVNKLAERVRSTIQAMLDRAVGARRSVFFG